MSKKKIVIVGATSAIAIHCARLWVEKEPVDFTLLGRDSDRLERVANDLLARNKQVDVQCILADFLDSKKIAQTVQSIANQGKIDIVLIAQGLLTDQSACEKDLSLCQNGLQINGISPVLYAEAFANYMAKINFGTIALIGSVAGDRGRKSNYVYGAAKELVSRYMQGLQHRFAHSGVKIVLIKPGPTDTPMTAHLKQKMASPAEVAGIIVVGIQKGQSVIYAPKKWFLIMLIIRHIPAFVFNKINI